jgi:ACT domain-containing protein
MRGAFGNPVASRIGDVNWRGIFHMHVMTENEARSLAQRIERGGRISVPVGTILTPMARDYLHSRGIQIDDANAPNHAKPAKAAGGDDALVEAVAAEVARALQSDKGARASGSAQAASALADSGKSTPGKADRAVVWGIGGDRPGILADVAELLGKRKINIIEISQTILSGVFAMVMIVDTSSAEGAFGDLKAELEGLGKKLGINLSAQRDEIFQYMHRI